MVLGRPLVDEDLQQVLLPGAFQRLGAYRHAAVRHDRQRVHGEADEH
jgi:hypothetical protein